MSDIFKALSSPVRREILFMLREGNLMAGEIADRLLVGKATLSGHFNVLKPADLVRAERKGTSIVYSLNMSVVEEALAAPCWYSSPLRSSSASSIRSGLHADAEDVPILYIQSMMVISLRVCPGRKFLIDSIVGLIDHNGFSLAEYWDVHF